MGLFRRFSRSLHGLTLRFWRRRTIAVRALLCWAVGAILITIDQSGNHDLRYRLRGPRPGVLDSRIVIVDVSEREWLALDPQIRNILRPLKEVSITGDSIFWNTVLWERILSRVLADLPVAVGVTFHFGESVRTGKLGPATRALFEDPRVVWGADLDSAGRALIPVFATTYNRNVANRSLRVDDDGTLRRYSPSLVQIPHMGTRLAEIAILADMARPQSVGEIRSIDEKLDGGRGASFDSPIEINYLGAAGSFPTVSVRDLLEGRVPPEAFHGKIVIIGNRSDTSELYTTPLGRMSRSETIANITDNLLRDKVPRRVPLWISFAISALIVLAAVLFILNYPQPVVIFGIVLGALGWFSLSAWLFDSFAYWLPAIGPVVQIAVTYIVFLSHQVSANEARNWRLEQDRKASEELEQLKTNFVSMMSHDLKTPIAKIQAICDRLLSRGDFEGEIADDLRNLRRSSDDLHRYIRSILQVTKIEARDFAISREPLDVNESIERVLGRLRPLAREKQIEITADLEPLFSIEADPTLLEEMIHNLVENGVKYTPVGGRIQVASREENDYVVVSVHDTGPGIPAEDQELVWNKFTRGHKANNTASGSGLGLYLVKYFVELHGGMVFLESSPGLGTRIGFRLPV